MTTGLAKSESPRSPVATPASSRLCSGELTTDQLPRAWPRSDSSPIHSRPRPLLASGLAASGNHKSRDVTALATTHHHKAKISPHARQAGLGRGQGGCRDKAVVGGSPRHPLQPLTKLFVFHAHKELAPLRGRYRYDSSVAVLRITYKHHSVLERYLHAVPTVGLTARFPLDRNTLVISHSVSLS